MLQGSTDNGLTAAPFVTKPCQIAFGALCALRWSPHHVGVAVSFYIRELNAYGRKRGCKVRGCNGSVRDGLIERSLFCKVPGAAG